MYRMVVFGEWADILEAAGLREKADGYAPLGTYLSAQGRQRQP